MSSHAAYAVDHAFCAGPIPLETVIMEPKNIDQNNEEHDQPPLSPRDADRRQAEEESKAEPISKPGGFQNHPDDPTNPNEVRERFLRKIRR
jgi:hypothetical protein